MIEDLCEMLNCVSWKCKRIIRALLACLLVFSIIVIIALIRQLWGLYKLWDVLREADLPIFTELHHSVLLNFVLLVIFAVGAHGAYAKSPMHLTLFALSISAYAAIRFSLVSPDVPEQWSYYHKFHAASQAELRYFGLTMVVHAREYERDLPTDHRLGPKEGTRVWDLIQSRLQCCGLDGREDWRNGTLMRYTGSGEVQPRSCCQGVSINTNRKASCLWIAQLNFTDGCLRKISDIMRMTWLSVDPTVGSLLLLLLGLTVQVLACMPSRWYIEQPDYLNQALAAVNNGSSNCRSQSSDELHNQHVGVELKQLG